EETRRYLATHSFSYGRIHALSLLNPVCRTIPFRYYRLSGRAADKDLCGLRSDLAPLPDRHGESLEHRQRGVPIDTPVGNTLAVCQRLAGDEVLSTSHQIAFDHHAEDALVAGFHLHRDIVQHLRLLPIILMAVRMTGIHHELGPQS